MLLDPVLRQDAHLLILRETIIPRGGNTVGP